jgi:UDP-N-acetyl-D-galactosamine dehydrogenase
VVDVIDELKEYGVSVDVHDPWADPTEANHEYGLDLVKKPEAGSYDGVILAVAHQDYRDSGSAAIRAFGQPSHVLYDLKHVLGADESDLRL